jgi:uncharacterized phage protein gp47/JayE
MPDYIGVPIETDPDVLSEASYDYLQSQVDGWEPAEGNLETILIDTNNRRDAELRDLASRVPTSIFRAYGELVGVDPVDGAKATVSVTITTIDNKGYTIVAGTQFGFRTSGDEIVIFEVLADIVVSVGSTTAIGTLIALDIGAAASNLGAVGIPMQLVTPLDYVTSAVMLSASSGGADAETDAEYLNHLATRLQTLANRPILAQDFATLARDIAGVARAVAVDNYNPAHNLLTLNEASLETSAADWMNIQDATVARSTTQAADGVASLSMAAIAAGDMAANLVPASYKVVTPGQVCTALASFRAATVGRNCQVAIYWWTPVPGYVGQVNSVSVVDTTTGWTQAAVTGVCPPGATRASVVVNVFGAAGAGELHYADKMLLRGGTDTLWVPGGTPATGNERMVMVVPVDENGESVGPTTLAAVQSYLDGLREQNFVVTARDPNYTNVDISFTVVAVAGQNTSDVQARIVSALQDYLSPANWGLSDPGTSFGQQSADWNLKTVVRFREIDQVINDVAGVDYIVDVTIGINGGAQVSKTDITLGGVVPLPRPGTITGTVT